MYKPSWSYNSTKIDLPPGLANKIRPWGKSNVPASSIYIDPKDPSFGYADKPHVMVKYGLETDDAKEVRRAVKEQGPVKLRLGKMPYFESKDYGVLKIDVNSTDLHKLSRRTKENLLNKKPHSTYRPHVTIAYLKRTRDLTFIQVRLSDKRSLRVRSLSLENVQSKR